MTDFSQRRVTIKHIRQTGLCMSGARNWFAENGVDWNTFLEEGVTLDFAEKIDDAFSELVCEAARKDFEDGRR